MLSLQRMHAAIFYGPNNIANEEINCDYHEGREVLLRVKACAICGYDVGVFRNGHQKVKPPIILGHEIAGEVNSDVRIEGHGGIAKTIEAGSRVSISPILPCLECYYCSTKNYNLCSAKKEIGSTLDGGFAEFVRVPESIVRTGGLTLVPDNLSNEEAALIEPLACCLNGFSQLGPVDKDSTVAIIGDGPIGLLHLQLSNNLYQNRTIVVGKIQQRLDMARSLGASATVMAGNSSEVYTKKDVEEILGFTNGVGVGAVIIATSDPASVKFALKIASKNSRINLFAGMPQGSSILLDTNMIHYNQISITGSFSSTPVTLEQAAMLASNRIIDLSKMITHKYSLADIGEALLATENYYGLRVVINKF